jgi:hypothetical protein
MACLWLVKWMSEHKETLIELLLVHPNFEVREAFARLMKMAVSVTAKNEEAYFSETTVLQDGTQIATSAVIRFMQWFFGELFDGPVREHWRRYEEYFDLLKDFSQQSFFATKFVVEQRGIYRLVEFLMNRKPPFD